MCPSEATCLSADDSFSELHLQHYKNPTNRVVLVHSGPHHHPIANINIKRYQMVIMGKWLFMKTEYAFYLSTCMCVFINYGLFTRSICYIWTC
jgi:hypothetical protein